MLEILSSHTSDHKRKKPKVTCTTCKLKKCVGRCQWEVVNRPESPKAA